MSEIVEAGIKNAKKAVADVCGQQGREAFVAMDLAPTGKLLKPFGTMEFDEAYELYKEMVVAGAAAGADLMVQPIL